MVYREALQFFHKTKEIDDQHPKVKALNANLVQQRPIDRSCSSCGLCQPANISCDGCRLVDLLVCYWLLPRMADPVVHDKEASVHRNRCSAVASAGVLKTLFSNAIVMAVYPPGIVNVDLLRNLQLIHKARHGPFYARKHLFATATVTSLGRYSQAVTSYLLWPKPASVQWTVYRLRYKRDNGKVAYALIRPVSPTLVSPISTFYSFLKAFATLPKLCRTI